MTTKVVSGMGAAIGKHEPQSDAEPETDGQPERKLIAFGVRY